MKNVSIIGAGVMGHGIALVFALGGYQVVLQDVSPEALSRAQRLMDSVLRTLFDAGAVDPQISNSSLKGCLTCTTDLAEAAQADLIVEAVTENADIKRALFAALDMLAPQDALWASNTSSLNIFDLLPERRLSRSLIAHWYSPPYIVDLVDLVPGLLTEPGAVTVLKGVLERLGKKPIVLPKFISGFIANRLQAALNLEVFFLLDHGYATPEQIDEAVKSGLALRMPLLGHLKKADFTGLELIQQLLANKSYAPPECTGRSQILDEHIKQGRTGVMTGKGFYDYGHRPAEELFRERDLKLIALKKFLVQLGDIA